MAISDVYRSFIARYTIFTNSYLTQWISKLLVAFESKLNESVGHNEHDCLQDRDSQVSGIAHCPNF